MWTERAAPSFRAAYGFDPEVPVPISEGNIHLVSGFAEQLDLRDGIASVVVSIDVVEHLPDPHRAFKEFMRVLRRGGRILTLTPNKQHPPLLFARPLPNRARQFLNRFSTGTCSEDTFPAFYRANTVPALQRLAKDVGLNVISLDYISNHPQYLMFSKFLYRIGVSIERRLHSSERYAFLRQYIFAEFEKP